MFQLLKKAYPWQAIQRKVLAIFLLPNFKKNSSILRAGDKMSIFVLLCLHIFLYQIFCSIQYLQAECLIASKRDWPRLVDAFPVVKLLRELSVLPALGVSLQVEDLVNHGPFAGWKKNKEGTQYSILTVLKRKEKHSQATSRVINLLTLFTEGCKLAYS